MKKPMSIKTTFIGFLIIIFGIEAVLNFSSCSTLASKGDSYLLGTQWDQVGMYAKFCPNNDRAGCWSTAVSQILYFHRIMPTGRVNYLTTAGHKITEDLDSYKFNWKLFTEKLDDKTPVETIDQVAKYIYFTSAALEKDFDTGSYNTVKNEFRDGAPFLNVDSVINNLKSYFDCEVSDYHYTKEELGIYADDIEKLIKKEIDSSRPIMMYLQSAIQGHAAVIDGYSYAGDKFIVHINQGAGGYGNKWYDFNKPIISSVDDMNHRVLITVKPSKNNIKKVYETLNKTNYLLKTQWDIEGDYSKFYPEKKYLNNPFTGYWPTALAQILAYHKYQPAGEINYETSSGLKIKENLDSCKFSWDLFVERLDAKSSIKSIEQVAKYNYFTGVVLEEDFGSDGYKTIIEDESNLDVAKATNNLSKYFKCKARSYIYMGEDIKPSKSAIIGLIKDEIDKKCPLLLYYKVSSGDACCVVIDGYAEENNKFYGHINTGRDGLSNQWYELFSLLADVKYFTLVTVE